MAFLYFCIYVENRSELSIFIAEIKAVAAAGVFQRVLTIDENTAY